MPEPATALTVLVLASEKVRPAFDLLARLQPLHVIFSDGFLAPRLLLRNLTAMRRADVVYVHSPTNRRCVMIPLARLLGKPVVVQWIGTDVLVVSARRERRMFHDIGAGTRVAVTDTITAPLPGAARWLVAGLIRGAPLFVRLLKAGGVRHVACAPHLADTLARVGLQARFLPVLCHVAPEVLPFPAEWAVLAYVGYHHGTDERAFYGWHSLVRLAADCPELTVYVVGRKAGLGAHPPNIVFLGFVADIRQVLVRVRAVVRPTYHDGMPRLVLEGLATGRYIVTTQPLPHSRVVRSYAQLRRAVEDLRHCRGPNREGAAYVRRACDMRAVSRQFREVFCEAGGCSGNER